MMAFSKANCHVKKCWFMKHSPLDDDLVPNAPTGHVEESS
jgi:hypothetical protein